MAFRAMCTVAGHAIPDPSKYTGTTATVVDSARNAKAFQIGAVIRDDLGKIEMTWSFIEAQKWADILSLFSIKRGGSFYNSVTFYSQDSNDWETRTMYVNDRKASVFKRNTDGSIAGYLDASLSLIER